MPTPSYRVNLSFEADRKVWKARAPELENCAGEGATRAEAIGRLEEEIDAQVQNMLSQGSHPPTALDETTLTGELHVKVSAALHRDLLWQARQENVDVEHLMAEMLAAGLESRRGGGRPQRQQQQNRPAQDPDSIGNSVGRDRGNRGNGGRYNPQLMEDRANFIEYVRNLEHNGGVPGGAGPGRGPNGGGGGGGRQNNDRRRNRGPRGPGGAQNAGGGGGGRGF